MAEDIDDLLDEVETKFVREKSSTKRVTNSKTIRYPLFTVYPSGWAALKKKGETKFQFLCDIEWANEALKQRGASHSLLPESSHAFPNEVKALKKQEDDDLDKLIDDICGDPEPLIGHLQEKCNITQSGQVNSRKPQRPLSSKCYPLYIGGTSSSKGLGSSFNKKSCDSIRCTSCDFRVVSFDDFEWDKSTDYLFLRNHVPNFEKLKSKLNSRRGYRAYCCQCSHVSVNILTDVKDLQLKWVCGRH